MNTAFQDLLGLVPEAADSELDGADEEELRAQVRLRPYLSCRFMLCSRTCAYATCVAYLLQLERDLEACEIILDVQEEVRTCPTKQSCLCQSFSIRDPLISFNVVTGV